MKSIRSSHFIMYYIFSLFVLYFYLSINIVIFVTNFISSRAVFFFYDIFAAKRFILLYHSNAYKTEARNGFCDYFFREWCKSIASQVSMTQSIFIEYRCFQRAINFQRNIRNVKLFVSIFSIALLVEWSWLRENKKKM